MAQSIARFAMGLVAIMRYHPSPIELAEPERGLERSLQKLKAMDINTAFWMDYRIQPEEAAITPEIRLRVDEVIE